MVVFRSLSDGTSKWINAITLDQNFFDAFSKILTTSFWYTSS